MAQVGIGRFRAMDEQERDGREPGVHERPEQARGRAEQFKDNKFSVEKHVAEIAKELGGSIKVVKYVRFEKGEGIEKRQDDLAAEVAKLVK